MYEVMIGFNVITKEGELRFEVGELVEKLPAEADVKGLLEAGVVKEQPSPMKGRERKEVRHE